MDTLRGVPPLSLWLKPLSFSTCRYEGAAFTPTAIRLSLLFRFAFYVLFSVIIITITIKLNYSNASENFEITADVKLSTRLRSRSRQFLVKFI